MIFPILPYSLLSFDYQALGKTEVLIHVMNWWYPMNINSLKPGHPQKNYLKHPKNYYLIVCGTGQEGAAVYYLVLLSLDSKTR